MSGQGDVVILTARSNIAPVEGFLKEQGFSGIDVVAVGNNKHMKKQHYVLKRVKEDT